VALIPAPARAPDPILDPMICCLTPHWLDCPTPLLIVVNGSLGIGVHAVSLPVTGQVCPSLAYTVRCEEARRDSAD